MRINKGEGLAQRLYESMVEEMRSGGLKPGDRLPPETELALQFGVSRTILREALASLKQEGYIESRQGKGITVRGLGERKAFRFSGPGEDPSPEDARHLYELRALLESDAAGLAAARASARNREALARSFEAMAAAVRAGKAGDEAHEAFNAEIARASGNPFLVELLDFIRARLRRLSADLRLRTMLDRERSLLVLEEHRAVLDAIASGDATMARQATLAHLRAAASRAGIEIRA